MAAIKDIPSRAGTFPASLGGLFWLTFGLLGAMVFFYDGLAELFAAWALPEYSHGPLIPVLSGFLLLRHLKSVPIQPGPAPDQTPGVVLLILALLLGAAGRLIQVGDIVAYALILWAGAILLICFGWRTGRQFWPSVLHLVYMLPLPGALYYGVSTYLQGVSSELGVYFLDMLRIPVFLEGNIIDLGVYKLHVAEACSGLRYLFPILSFSYIFAALYRGPTWHKAVLLISAVPITIFMNSVRIALAGVVVNSYGLEYVEGFTHFFEGWVIFVSCIAILFVLALGLVMLRRDRVGLFEALDLDTDGMMVQLRRITLVQPTAALISAAVLAVGLSGIWMAVPARDITPVQRDPFATFPSRLGGWDVGDARPLDENVARILAADDYHSVSLSRAEAAAPVDLFLAWYRDQSNGGVHSPEDCLPGAGWEISKLERIRAPDDIGAGGAFPLNRAIVQKGVDRMLVYYWYEQQGTRTASILAAKISLMQGKILNGRNDSALVRLITPMLQGETIDQADARLTEAMGEVIKPLARFVPGVDGA
ncbi:MAG: VPLPA-CTERM-specific exosortase XrtD [Sulfitobacter sp.]